MSYLTCKDYVIFSGDSDHPTDNQIEAARTRCWISGYG